MLKVMIDNAKIEAYRSKSDSEVDEECDILSVGGEVIQ